jgi:hypothetical protein
MGSSPGENKTLIPAIAKIKNKIPLDISSAQKRENLVLDELVSMIYSLNF